MIDLKDLREKPERYRKGTADKGHDPGLVDRLLAIDAELRKVSTRLQELTAEKNRIGKQIGQIAGQLKKAEGDAKAKLAAEMAQLQQRPNEIKAEEEVIEKKVRELEPKRDELWLLVPQPADADVPVGRDSSGNMELKRWEPDFDVEKSFAENRGFEPKSHFELLSKLGLVDVERGTKIAGSRSYVMIGEGFQLYQAILRYAFDFMTHENGFTPVSAAALVRDGLMVGTGFFPHGRDQVYQVANPTGEGYGLALTGTGEVGLMGFHADEIIDGDKLPRCYTTVSTCFRREAGASGKDTAGLYRVHQFDKVEQVVICRADEAESRMWHKKMIGFVETLLQRLKLPYRLLQCCTGDLGVKNADMVDIECWMPSRAVEGGSGWGETHSASRLYDYQCRRLNTRYKDPETGKNIVAHSLNNTVAACPRLMIPIVEMYQNQDGSIEVPGVLRAYMKNVERIG